jgi:hypothetical protein
MIDQYFVPSMMQQSLIWNAAMDGVLSHWNNESFLIFLKNV